MPRWSEIQAIVDKYRAGKGPFRKFFGTQSSYIEALSAILKEKKMTETLTFEQRQKLIKQAFSSFATDKEISLSYQLSCRVANLCFGDKSGQITATMRKLFLLKVLKSSTLDLFFQATTKQAILAAKAIDTLLPQNPRQPSKAFVRQLSEKAESLESYIGVLYEEKNDYSKAITWYQSGVTMRQQDSLFLLTQLYANRPQYINKQAMTYLKQALSSEHAGTLANFNKLAHSDPSIALMAAKYYEKKDIIKHTLSYYKILAKHKELKAFLWLINFYQKKGLINKVSYYHHRAALKNHLPSVCYLFNYYWKGEDTIKNYQKAIQYAKQANTLGDNKPLTTLKKVASNGHVAMQYSLGYAYSQSHAYQQAAKWLIMAVNHQHLQAKQLIKSWDCSPQVLFDIAKQFSTPPNLNLNIADYLFQKSVSKNHLPAILYLAQRDNSLYYYTLAKNVGYEPAGEIANRLKQEGGYDPKAMAQYYKESDPQQAHFWRKEAKNTSCMTLKSDKIHAPSSNAYFSFSSFR